MRIGGLQEFSLIDYPGKMAAVIFTQGCNFRCPYCHNPELVLPESFEEVVDEQQIFWFLEKRIGRLEAVVITGGEPTIQNGLIGFLQKIKKLGYLIKLDTNGSNPDILSQVLTLGLVDYVAMDVKASIEKYDKLCGCVVNTGAIKESIELIKQSNADHEFRTTLVKELHHNADEEISRILDLINGGQKYRLQGFQATHKMIDRTLLEKGQYAQEEIDGLKIKWEGRVEPQMA